ncbi:hypothetical protein SAMN02949497_0905 [Methylomagnum ishizawai]|uniref:Uncharacterized protein n=2 Tax=Methylomagnum ishizawai TaxID=1760988 RepID=A0A1Y6CSN9_9GAMM|nr:hypothetical protein SAMN02949497_0905 [Methylomagnum ishizawai]
MWWLALAGRALAGDSDPGDLAPEIQAPKAPDQASPVFSEDEQKRLQELRRWLLLRQQERKLQEPGKLDALKQARAADLADPAPRPKSNPVLHIGRGPDGRIHHRYIFNESGPDQLQSAVPEYSPALRRSR